jgi:ribosome-associated translation inhibitor RaiA
MRSTCRSTILQCKKSGPDPLPAFDLASKALLREVTGLKSELRRESDYQTVARRKL